MLMPIENMKYFLLVDAIPSMSVHDTWYGSYLRRSLSESWLVVTFPARPSIENHLSVAVPLTPAVADLFVFE